jgi:hypothetical protein
MSWKGQRIMERSRDTGQSSKAERTRSPRRDEFRRRAESSRRNDAELSDQLVKRPSLGEIKTASAEVRAELCTQAIEKGRAKMQKYQQEAERYQNKERDTFEEFEMNFENSLTHLNVDVVKFTSKSYYGEYENIDV